MLKLIILGILILGWACAPGKGKRKAKQQSPAKAVERTCTAKETSDKRSSQPLSLAQLEALEDQINAACELGIALDRKAREQTDQVKRARLAQQSANAYAKAATIQARIDKLLLAA